jgi:hypothetical protein
VLRESRTHLRDAGEIAVVREGERDPRKLERVHVLQRNLDLRAVRDAAHVREHAPGCHLRGEVLQVAVEDRQRIGCVREGRVRVVRSGVPRANAEAREVEHVQHLRHVALAHQRRIGLEQQVVEEDRLSEVEKRAAHGPFWHGPGSADGLTSRNTPRRGWGNLSPWASCATRFRSTLPSTGSRRERFLIELLGNSAIFPLANILLELFQQGAPAYFREQHFYTMCAAAIAQALYLSRDRAKVRVFAGNLIGPVIYTVIEALAEGPEFFGFLHHYEYWAFAGTIGALQAGMRTRAEQGAGLRS